jgi:putative ABC transport system substrate-binding protein
MQRREFVRLLGSAAVFWPLGSRAQRLERVRQIGFVLGLDENDPEGRARITAFREGLEALGWTEGGNIRMTLDLPAAIPNVFALMSRSW